MNGRKPDNALLCARTGCLAYKFRHVRIHVRIKVPVSHPLSLLPGYRPVIKGDPN